MTRVAFVFSCNDRYFPLAKGLVLSLADHGWPDAGTSLTLIDIGCTDADRAWCAEHGVNVVRFDYRDHYSFPADAQIKPHYGSLLCRPLIPRLVPDHELYVHIDSDIWVQERSFLQDYIDIGLRFPDRTVITPCLDYSYQSEFRKTFEHLQAIRRGYLNLYGVEVANRYFVRPLLSCGLFAMHRDSRIWEMWYAQLVTAFGRNFEIPGDKPASEQLALNYLLYETDSFLPLSAGHNYQGHGGFILRAQANGKVVVGYPPYETVGIIHLTCAEINMASYHKYALLYDMGRYLTAEDRRILGITAG